MKNLFFRAHAGFVISCILFSTSSFAEIQRDFEPRFSTNVGGDIQIVGNTLLSCSTEQNPNRGFCQEARDGGEGRNNQFYMDHVDLDGNSFTFNSSSADLSLPAHGKIEWAGLYWGARLSDGKFGGLVAPDSELAPKVLFGPKLNYQEIVAQQVDRFASTFSAYADVTQIVRTQKSGSTLSYWAANVQSGTGGNRHAGWALVVAYSDPSQPLRNLVVFDGYADVRKADNVTTEIKGFATPLTGEFSVRLGSVTYDGDLTLRGDRIQVNGDALTDPETNNNSNNIFNAGIMRLGKRLTDKQPDYVNQLGVDINMFQSQGHFSNGTQSAELTFESKGDIYYPAVLTMATEVFHPILDHQFQQTVTDLNGGHPLPGEVLRYEAVLRNSGRDPATDVTFVGTIPPGTRYEPGSLAIIQDDASPDNVGQQSDEPNDDLAEFDGEKIVFRLGRDADSKRGGQVGHKGHGDEDPLEKSVKLGFSVRVQGDITDKFPLELVNQGQVRYQSLSTGAELSGDSSVARIAIQEPPKAQIAVASQLDGAPKDNLDGTHSLRYVATLKNSGHTDFDRVDLIQDLSAVFQGAEFHIDAVEISNESSDLIKSERYTGKPPHTNMLDPQSKLTVGGSGSVILDVTVSPTTDAGPYAASFRARGKTFFDLVYEDQSTDGDTADANKDGNPTNDQEPTLVVFNSPPTAMPDVGEVIFGSSVIVNVISNDEDPDKEVLQLVSYENRNPTQFGELTQNTDGSFTYKAPDIEPENFNGAFEFDYVVSDGAGQLSNSTVTLKVPMAETDLGVKLVGPGKAVQLGDTLTLTVLAQNNGRQAAKPVVESVIPKGLVVESVDASQGVFTLETGHWEVDTLLPGNGKSPTQAALTVVARVESEQDYQWVSKISAEKLGDSKTRNNAASFDPKVLVPVLAVARTRVSKPTDNGDGSFSLDYEITVKNPGKVTLEKIQVVSELIASFAKAETFSVLGVSGDFSENPDFDGKTDASLLSGTDTLAAGAKGKVVLQVSLTPGEELGPYNNAAIATAESKHGVDVSADAGFSDIDFTELVASNSE